MIPHLSRRALVDFASSTGRRRGAAAEHLAKCPRCRTRLARLRALGEAAAEVTTTPMPDAWGAVEARLDARLPVILPLPSGRGGDARPAGSRRLVAASIGALLIAAGATAATVTFGPVRLFRSEDAVSEPEGARAALGIAAPVPAAGAVVELEGAGRALRVRIVVGEGPMLEVAPSGSAVSATFRVRPSGILVTGAESGILTISVPATAGVVRVLDGGREVAWVSGGRVETASGRRGVDVEISLDAFAPRGGEGR